MPTATTAYDFDFAVRLINSAKGPDNIFGPRGDDDEDWFAAAQKTFRTLSMTVHPDTADGPADEATAAFAKLNEMWDRAQRKAGLISGFVITTKRRAYTATDVFAKGDIATLYDMTFPFDGTVMSGFLKIPRDPRNNDLIMAEAKALKALQNGEERWRAFFPHLLENFRHRDADTHVVRRVNALGNFHDLVSLADVKDAFPLGLDPRDLAWIWRRVLAALIGSSEVGLVHGALTPEHILIEPHQHGVVFADWCYSVEAGAKVGAIVPSRRDFYAPEILAKEPASTATDIYMASKVMLWMLGDKPITQLAAFAKGSALQSQSLRPKDPKALLAEFDELIERLFGPRRFRVFPDLPGRK